MTTESESGRGRGLSAGYSSGIMSDTAARVVSEFALDDDYYYFNEEEDQEDEAEAEFEFEFSVPSAGENSSPISADEIFANGQIKPLFPLFGDADSRQRSSAPKSTEIAPARLPLKKLLLSERETSLTASPSCSSSEADDFESANPATYCVWTPSKAAMSKKSKSTGSSKRWRLRNLVHRSHSDGRDNFAFVQPKPPQEEQTPPPPTPAKAAATTGNAHMEHYLKNRAARESDRKKSYLPYKQDLVRFFANVNGLSRTMQPF